MNWNKIKGDIRSEFPAVKQLQIQSLAHWLKTDSSVVILDVRKEKEYERSHLQNAKRLDPGTRSFPEDLLSKREQTIVLYCSVGYRSSKMADRLLALGFSKVYNLEGSIFEWANAGHPVFANGKEVRQVHPYNKKWGQLLDQRFH